MRTYVTDTVTIVNRNVTKASHGQFCLFLNLLTRRAHLQLAGKQREGIKMRTLTVKEVIKALQTKNPEAPVLLFATGGIPASSVRQIDDVQIKGADVAGILLS
jgi:hypothetical protein